MYLYLSPTVAIPVALVLLGKEVDVLELVELLQAERDGLLEDGPDHVLRAGREGEGAVVPEWNG